MLSFSFTFVSEHNLFFLLLLFSLTIFFSTQTHTHIPSIRSYILFSVSQQIMLLSSLLNFSSSLCLIFSISILDDFASSSGSQFLFNSAVTIVSIDIALECTVWLGICLSLYMCSWSLCHPSHSFDVQIQCMFIGFVCPCHIDDVRSLLFVVHSYIMFNSSILGSI